MFAPLHTRLDVSDKWAIELEDVLVELPRAGRRHVREMLQNGEKVDEVGDSASEIPSVGAWESVRTAIRLQA